MRLKTFHRPGQALLLAMAVAMAIVLLWAAGTGTARADSGSHGPPADSLTIKVGYFGGPYYTKKVYTLSDLEAMPQVQQAYTFIDNMPAVVIDSGKGVRLADLLVDAGIDVNSVESFYFYATDIKVGWYECLPKSYLLDTVRYYYPNLPAHWDYSTQSSIPGAVYGAIPVDPIIAYQDNWKRFATAPDFSVQDTSIRYRLVFGQTDTVTQTASRSVKWVHEIDVMLGGMPPSAVTINQNIANLKIGSTVQLQAIVAPADAIDKSVTWSSSDIKVAEVDQNGLVTVVGPGTATITATTVVGNKTAICVVNGHDEAGGGQDAAPASTDPQQYGAQNARGTPDTRDQQFLKARGAADASSAAADITSQEAGDQPWRVYKMSADAVSLQLQRKQSGLGAYAVVIFLILFLSGSLRRYAEYAREVAR